MLSSEIAADVARVCRENAEPIAAALARVLDGEVAVEIGQPGLLDLAALASDGRGAGLVIAALVDGSAVVAVLSEASGLLPAWYRSPDAAGESKLATLAQELGKLVLPQALAASDFKAGRVADVELALGAAGFPPGAATVPIALAAGERRGVLHLLWPAGAPGMLFGQPSPKVIAPPAYHAEDDEEDRFRRLPAYSQSLLRIGVPVRVRLAAKKKRAQDVVALGPGQILQFEKSCDEMLDLLVGEEHIAIGEAVKIGDKFGLRVTSITLPEERFRKVGG